MSYRFAVVGWGDHEQKPRVILSRHNALLKARMARKVSGDLVVRLPEMTIVNNNYWLWNWEREDPTSYASRMMTMYGC